MRSSRRVWRYVLAGVAVFAAVLALPPQVVAQAPIEDALVLQTPVSKFITDAALKAFAEYAKERWGVTVKVSALHAGTPVSYGRIVEWKGRPEADIFWGGESALFDDLAEKKLLVKLDLSKEACESIPPSIGKPKPIFLKDPKGFWVGTALEPYGLVYHPRLLARLGVPPPKDWEDLLHPKLKGNVAQCAPTRSSSSHATYEVILQGQGYEKGWEWLRKLAAYSGIFTARSRDVPSVVAKGEFAAGFAVPSYMAFEE
ncbi:MAG: extracellular solute-binding protein, partial [Candidatus Rokubacteria bacterium]|nr:extracellular solute-binding protein [Candidatus Rokubacteria bacterium]